MTTATTAGLVCPGCRCRRRQTPEEYGRSYWCRRCRATARADRVRAYARRDPTGHTAPGEGEHLVCLDDRHSLQDALVARVRTRAEAEEMVRGLNRAALAGMPGVEAARVPLYYCVSEGVGDDGS
jgi:hypothetical protein